MTPGKREWEGQAPVRPATDLIGHSVVNPEGEDLGKIENLVVATNSGQIVYAVLSFGGFLGLGDKFFAIPWEALNIEQDGNRVVLGLDKARLEQAPGFNKEDWPDMADPHWHQLISDYYRS